MAPPRARRHHSGRAHRQHRRKLAFEGRTASEYARDIRGAFLEKSPVHQHFVAGCTTTPRTRLLGTSAEPRVVFSQPKLSKYDIPDCYKVYKTWCPDLAQDLRGICFLQLDYRPTQADKFVTVAQRRHEDFRVFLNPGKLVARLQSLKRLEDEYPGLRVAAILARNPIIVARRSANIKAKLTALCVLFDLRASEAHQPTAHLGSQYGAGGSAEGSVTWQQVMRTASANSAGANSQQQSLLLAADIVQKDDPGASDATASMRDASGGEQLSKLILRCPSLLTRSIKAITTTHSLLQQHLGAEVARSVTLTYPEIYSRNTATLMAAIEDLVEVWGSRAAMAKLVRVNPALLKARVSSSVRLQAIEEATRLPPSAVRDAVYAVPTVLNLAPSTLRAKVTAFEPALAAAWGASPAELPPSVLANLLIASQTKLARLQYVAFLRGAPRKTRGLTGPHPAVAAAVSAAPETASPTPTAARVRSAGSEQQGVLRLKKPSVYIAMTEQAFNKEFPRFTRWLRRKRRQSAITSDVLEGTMA